LFPVEKIELPGHIVKGRSATEDVVLGPNLFLFMHRLGET